MFEWLNGWFTPSEKTIETMQAHKDFPDNCHPNRHIHKLLAEEIERYV